MTVDKVKDMVWAALRSAAPDGRFRASPSEAQAVSERMFEVIDKLTWQVRDTCVRAEKAEERMGEILRAKDIIERLTGQRERFYGALTKMVAAESMVEAAHAKAGNPYFNVALNEARAVLKEIK